jgi:hypothetical protein
VLSSILRVTSTKLRFFFVWASYPLFLGFPEVQTSVPQAKRPVSDCHLQGMSGSE